MTGAPGVTTTALGLTFAWPRDVVLVDADRAASQTLLAGYLNDVPTGGRGLTSLTQLWRDGLDLGSDLPKHMVTIPGTEAKTTQHWFVPGFARPGSSTLFEPIWPELMDALASLDRQGIDVILDAGRWGSQGLPAATLANTRQLVMVTRSTLPALATLRLYLPDVTAATGATPSCNTQLVVVGPGAPYSAREIGDHFKSPTDELPWQPEDAAYFSDGRPGGLRLDKRLLARSYAALAAKLRATVDRWDAQFDHSATRTAEGVPTYV
ncbi:MAG: hypothetical protein FWD63_04175 [Propionibacteriaceae bacterium]|nr:hypothetical protein [Propionibacteriaceae bacterium]